MRISDWSSDVCSSDLAATLARTESVEACADHVDWIETHALNAIRGIRAMNAKADEADAALFAAWDRRLAAFNTLQELPDNPQGDGETPDRDAQWAIVNAAEAALQRSEERRVGKACVSTCRSRW